MRACAFLVLASACANEARIELPDPQGAHALIVAIEGHHDELILLARKLDDPASPPLSAFSLDTRADRLTLLYFAETLEALGVAEGELGPSAPAADGVPLPMPARILEASFSSGALAAWTPRDALPAAVASYRLPKGPEQDPCVQLSSDPIRIDARLPVAFAVSVDPGSAVLAAIDCRFYRVQDTGSPTAPIAMRLLAPLGGTCTSTTRSTAAVRDDAGDLWIGRQDGHVVRVHPPFFANGRNFATETSTIVMALAASRGVEPQELYALSLEGRLQRYDDGTGAWRTLWNEDVERPYRRLAWIRTGELLLIDSTACVRRWLASDHGSIDRCESVTEPDLLPLFTGVAEVEGIGTVLGGGLFGGALAGSGALFRNRTRPGEWEVLAVMPPISAVVSATAMVPFDRGFFFVGLTNVIGQYYPPSARACDVRQLASRMNLVHWNDIIRFGEDRMLISGVPIELESGVGSTVQWLSRITP